MIETAERLEKQRREASVLGMWLFLGAETMVFAGLLFSYYVLQTIHTAPSIQELQSSTILILCGAQSIQPPTENFWLPGGIQLPISVTTMNTIFLLVSAVTMELGTRQIKRGKENRLLLWLVITAIFGTTFVVIQGHEWTRLLGVGLSTTDSIFGALFYTIIGIHGIHVVGGLTFLLLCVINAFQGKYSRQGHHQQIRLCKMYWWFVVLVWPVLFFSLYL